MAVTYKDYYEILGVARDASAEAIRKAYRRKARELHPDVNKSSSAQAQFQDLNEAHAVLSDPEKRRRYDQLGADWAHGAPFEPPPGFGPQTFRFETHGDLGDLGDLFGAGDRGGFSEFFSTLFGDLGGLRQRGGGKPFERPGAARRGQDVQADIELELADLLSPGQRRITLGLPSPDGTVERKTVTVNIPAGVRPGQRLRLPGLGGTGAQSGPAGDIYLRISVRPEAGVAIEDDDIVVHVAVPASVAVIGGEVRVKTPEGPLTVRVPEGSQPGRVLRVRGRGLPVTGGGRGDLRVKLDVTLPRTPEGERRQLWERLAELDKEEGSSNQ